MSTNSTIHWRTKQADLVVADAVHTFRENVLFLQASRIFNRNFRFRYRDFVCIDYLFSLDERFGRVPCLRVETLAGQRRGGKTAKRYTFVNRAENARRSSRRRVRLSYKRRASSRRHFRPMLWKENSRLFRYYIAGSRDCETPTKTPRFSKLRSDVPPGGKLTKT